jgi:hypothetical protein
MMDAPSTQIKFVHQETKKCYKLAIFKIDDLCKTIK